ncbi:Acyl-CoA thioesterase 8, partial [Dissophora globulifera]
GNIVGQALNAAIKTVPSQFSVHSFHSYFLLAGNDSTPIVYQVERLRDGKSYCTRSVKAVQGGKSIYICMASFQALPPYALGHQYPMPDVPHHSTLPSQDVLMKALIDSDEYPENVRQLMAFRMQEDSMDFKATEPQTLKEFFKPPASTQQSFWFRCKSQLGDESALHQCVIAFASDYHLPLTVLLAHGSNWVSKEGGVAMMASLDHSVWFHSSARGDEWMLYVCESPHSGFDRGLVIGRIYKEDGTLAASVVQEGVFRLQQKFIPFPVAVDKPKL